MSGCVVGIGVYSIPDIGECRVVVLGVGSKGKVAVHLFDYQNKKTVVWKTLRPVADGTSGSSHKRGCY